MASRLPRRVTIEELQRAHYINSSMHADGFKTTFGLLLLVLQVAGNVGYSAEAAVKCNMWACQ